MSGSFRQLSLADTLFRQRIPRVNSSSSTSNPASSLLSASAPIFVPRSSLSADATEFLPTPQTEIFSAPDSHTMQAGDFATFSLDQDPTPRASEPAVVASPQLFSLSQESLFPNLNIDGEVEGEGSVGGGLAPTAEDFILMRNADIEVESPEADRPTGYWQRRGKSSARQCVQRFWAKS